ncbi:MAG: cob(I)yrinic acid a,c-diamide adenosyltransferase [Pseudoflavonifractor sp.]|nr:cob(I)yrinic acid a,c-diamide adenosyltransferase [Pseudoflavonifractor sp.]
MEKSRLYTRTGDEGMTCLVGGKRHPKASTRIEAYGTVDELNSWVGLLISVGSLPDEEAELLTWVQMRLFDIGSYLACPPAEEGKTTMLTPGVDSESIERLERAIDRLDAATPRVKRFVLPGGCPGAAHAQVARTVARRAERRILALHSSEPVEGVALRFVNRLSDYLFILGRHLNSLTSTEETFWERDNRAR